MRAMTASATTDCPRGTAGNGECYCNQRVALIGRKMMSVFVNIVNGALVAPSVPSAVSTVAPIDGQTKHDPPERLRMLIAS